VAQRLSRCCERQGWLPEAMRTRSCTVDRSIDPGAALLFAALPKGRGRGRRVYLTSFAYGEEYETMQVALGDSALRHGATHLVPWRRADLCKTAFYRENRAVLDLQRGSGYWLWKPFIILQLLLAIDEGDYVWYHDSGYTIKADVTPIIDWAERFNDGIMPGIYLPCYASREWTKRDCYVYMGCDDERFWNHCLIQPGWSFWRKSPRSIDIVAQWLHHALDPRILTDHPNTCGLPNLPGFIDHRHDQSVFTNIFIKNGLKSFGTPDDPLPRYPKDIEYLADRAARFLDASAGG
jgi:hypothetical protein